jgi:hypothetical protein
MPRTNGNSPGGGGAPGASGSAQRGSIGMPLSVWDTPLVAMFALDGQLAWLT